MKKRLQVLTFLLLMISPVLMFSTHIVGGTLNYVHNGGSSYTITLKLFRDCGAGTAAFPGTVTITVLGLDGTPFTPSRDITMTLGPVTPVPSSLPPCAQQPNPMPCTQQGVYTTTVTNLPPNPGGYHLYYQQVARNLSLTNINAAGNDIGESFYAYIPGPINAWHETFTLANGTTVDNGTTAWSMANGTPAPASASVNGNLFQVTGADNSSVTWTSQVINIASVTGGANLSVAFTETGNLENSDSVRTYYSLNGGPLLPFANNGVIADDFDSRLASQTGLVGTTVQIVIRVRYGGTSPNSEVIRWDDVMVSTNTSVANTNPVFTLFPPLFLCLNTPFTFNHAATDANGDSLVYEFYTPFNGENAAGPLDPTFPNNTPTFTPIVFLPGYSTTSPLGGSALTLNSATGMLSGTPPLLGQFVVGILVKEYRNGVYLSSTLRDFQFNVVNCPQTLAVAIGPQNPTICFGSTSTTITANASGGTPPYSYLWNNVNPSASINVGVGTYSVTVTDASGCQVFAFVNVTAFNAPINANANVDQTRCITSPATTINATVTAASGGVWSNGTGTYSPNTTTLTNFQYTPSAAELAAGFVNLFLTTTGNGTCPSDRDTIRINYSPFTGTVTPTVTPISCFGANNGSATINITGGASPFTYAWNTAPAQATQTISNLGVGTYSVTITDAIGCTNQTTATITQPPILSVSATGSVASCTGGSISANASGGTGPYTYLWSPGGQTTTSITGLSTGTYSVTVTDARGCQATASASVAPPATLAVSLTSVNVSCFGGNNGTANSTVTGGLSPFTYSWSNGATSPNVTGLTSGTYTLTVTDNRTCTATATVTITQPTTLTVTATPLPETCENLNNGSASAVASGGTGPYTYLWQPGSQTTPTATALGSATYTVTVTDSKGCSRQATATVTQPAPVSATFGSQNNVSCFGGSNASVTVAGTGGTPGYTYTWMPGSLSGASVSGLSSGSYTVTVTDAQSCTGQNTVTITQPAVALSTTTTFTNVSCFAGTNGSITATPAGGTAPYNFSWAPGGQTTAAITNLIAGTYTVTVTDSKGCTTISTRAITQPTALTVGLTGVDVSCFGGSSGSITTTVSGGTPAYSYTWTPGGQTSSNVSGLIAGTYTVQVRDNLNCTQTASLTITQPSTLTVNATTTPETCDYSNNGTATANASGGTGPYTYLWQPGNQTTSTATGLTSGSYTVTVTDFKGCIKAAVTNVIQPNALAINFANQVNVSCFGGNNASVTALGSGGTPNYTYSWMPGSLSGAAVTGLSSGIYTVTITDANACTGQNTISITQPAIALSVSGTSTPASCFGGANGAVSAVATGGTTPYTNFNWMPGNLFGQNISNLSAGTYTVTVTDNNNCTALNTVVVNEPGAIVPSITTVSSSCSSPNGSASVTVTGGVGAYTFQWFPIGGTGTTTTPISSGTYTVLVTDANGCTASQSANVNDNSGPVASIFATTNVTCFGGSDGTATVAVVGGTGVLTYQWMPIGGNGPVATGLPSGTYTISVTDENNCQSLASTSPPISEPTEILIGITTTNVNCFGGTTGTASATATGGTGALSYLWLPGNTTGPTVSGLGVGTYTLQVTDANSCVKTQTFVINQPLAALSVSASSTQVSCFGGSNGTASSVVTGGTTPYNYTWMPGSISGQNISSLSANNYTVNVTDANGCSASGSISITQPSALALTTGSTNSTCGNPNGTATAIVSGGTGAYTYFWSPGNQSTSIITGILAGSHTVLVTDANNCSVSATVTVNNTAGPVVSVTGTNNVNCNGASDGNATTSVTGGTGTISYVWTPSGGSASIGTGLSTGVYTVTVTDANGCQSQATTATITEPVAITVNVSVTDVNCFGGNTGIASAAAAGGTPGYTYLWLPGGFSGTTISGLSAGTYTVRATDTKSCIHDEVFVVNQPLAALAVNITTTSVSCFGGADGTATANVSGGTSPYIYSWTPGAGISQTVSGLNTGNYTVNITDDKGCITNGSITVSQPAQALTATGSGAATSCFSGSDGNAFVTPVGGTPNYTYQWSPAGGTNQTASGLAPGNYIVTITDSKSCSTNVAISISQPTILAGALSAIDATCGLANGSVNAQISGGTAPYTYLWSTGATATASINNLNAGAYSLQITDAQNCVQTFSTSITNTPALLVSVTANNPVACFGGASGSAVINITQGTAPFSINWLPFGGAGTTATGLAAGSYTASVTDSIGCTNNATVITITEPAQLTVAIDSITNVSCNGATNGELTVIPSGGTPNYSYVWSPVTSALPTASNLGAGTYSVTVSDQNSCSVAVSMTVTEPTVLGSVVSSTINPICFGEDGSSTVTVSGGTIPYSYSWTSSPPQTGSTLEDEPAGSYTCTVTDANGCIITSIATIIEPTQVITTAGPDAIMCLGASGTINATATGGSGGYIFTWLSPATITSGNLPLSLTETTTFTVTAYDQNNCMGTPDTVTGIVYDLNQSSISVEGDSLICPGHSAAVFVQVNGNPGPLTYSWSGALGNGPGAYLVTPTVPTYYVATVTNPCGSIVRDSMLVAFNPPPTIVLLGDTNRICAPDSVHFNDGSISGNVNDPINSWTWHFGDGTTSTQQNPDHYYSSPGNYNVTLSVTTTGGCVNNNNSAPFNVQAFPYPNAAFTVNATTLNLPYEQLICTNQSTLATSYIWNFGDGTQSTLTNPQHNYNAIGTFEVQLIALSSQGCADTAVREVVTDADVVFPNAFSPDPTGPNGGNYIPNDLSNNVFFPFTSGVTEYKLQIFNRWGELIFESTDVKIGWDGYYRGKLCQQDVYVWKAFLKLNNGKTYNKTGDLTLLQ